MEVFFFFTRLPAERTNNDRVLINFGILRLKNPTTWSEKSACQLTIKHECNFDVRIREAANVHLLEVFRLQNNYR